MDASLSFLYLLFHALPFICSILLDQKWYRHLQVKLWYLIRLNFYFLCLRVADIIFFNEIKTWLWVWSALKSHDDLFCFVGWLTHFGLLSKLKCWRVFNLFVFKRRIIFELKMQIWRLRLRKNFLCLCHSRPRSGLRLLANVHYNLLQVNYRLPPRH